MVSTTSGTTSFNLDVDEIIEQALTPLGGEHVSGEEAKKARRALNLVLINLQNKNIPLSKLDFETINLVAGTQKYTLSTGVEDILECSLETDSYEMPMTRVGLKEWQRFPIKSQSGKPLQFVTERSRDSTSITFWPIPDFTYDVTALVSKRIEDVTASYQKVDINTRYLPLLIAWLSYELSKTRAGIDEAIKTRLENDYLKLLPDTFDEDRERVDIQIRLGGISGS
jgi:hypothetical protein